MKSLYLMFAAGVFAFFCLMEARGVAWDTNQTAPSPQVLSSRSSGGGYAGSTSSGGGSWGYFSSK